MTARNTPAPDRIVTQTAAHHEPAPRTGPHQAVIEGGPRVGPPPFDSEPDPETLYDGLIYGLSVGPGLEDASCIPDYSPHRHWVLVTISETSGHAWVSLHSSGRAAAQALSEDVDVRGIQVDEAETYLYSLDNGSRWSPKIYTRVVWQ